ncbi:MAG: DUF5715 family protein [Gemmatimonadaceae bacterium]
MHHRLVRAVALSCALSLLAASGLAAQSLRGSQESVDHLYLVARASGLQFHATVRSARRAVAAGEFVPLSGNKDYTPKSRMSLPYATPEVLTYIEHLAAEYHAACGERLVVTSALRPMSRRPRNGSVKSVHPTGIAVDVRKPKRRLCRDWLRQLLLQHEREGAIEATEEFRPPHFHIVVLQALERRTTEVNVIE